MAGFLEALEEVEAATFVGRDDALVRLAELAREAEGEPRLVVVVGPGGAGKSCLVRQFLRRSPPQSALWLSGERISPNADALEAALEARFAGGFAGLGRGDTADVLVLDGFEKIAAVERFLVDEALPKAGSKLCVIVTTRTRFEPGAPLMKRMRALTREIVVPPLDEEDARTFLAKRRVPESDHAGIWEFSAGHPLALTIIADHYAQKPEFRFHPRLSADIIAILVAELVRDVPSPAHEDALYACCMPHALDEELLTAMLACAPAEGRELFKWLGRLTFMERDHEGIVPHALVRNALYDDLLSNRPNAHLAFARNASEIMLARMNGSVPTRGHEQLLRALYMRRRAAPALDGFGMETLFQAYLKPSTAADIDELAAIVEHWEGRESSERYRRAFAHDSGLFYSLRDGGAEPVTINSYVTLRDLPEHVRRGDAVLEGAYELWRELEPEGKWDMAVARWWMTRKGYHALGPELQPQTMCGPFLLATRAPGLRYVVFANAPPEVWEPLAPSYGLRVTGRRVSTYGREMGLVVGDIHALSGGPQSPRMTVIHVTRFHIHSLAALGEATPRPALDEEAFASAVRSALAVLRRPHELSRSPLVDIGLAGGEGTAGVVAAFEAAFSALEAQPGYAESAKLLRATYLGASAKQEAIAADLGLPFGTYRHRLRRAHEELTAQLWATETGERASSAPGAPK